MGPRRAADLQRAGLATVEDFLFRFPIRYEDRGRISTIGAARPGQTVSLGDLFTAGDDVDVTGVSKGKGFAGHIKRHNFARGPKTHGSDHHREPGSIGPGTTPGRVYRGLKMAGHMGDERVTIKKVRVVRADTDRNLLLVKGSLPGARGSLILVKKA